MLLATFVTLTILSAGATLTLLIVGLNLGWIPRPEADEWAYKLLFRRERALHAVSATTTWAAYFQTEMTRSKSQPTFIMNMLFIDLPGILLTASQIAAEDFYSSTDATQEFAQFPNLNQ